MLDLEHIPGFPGGSDGKESACNAGDPCSIPGSGRLPGGGLGNPLQHSYLENSMDKSAFQATVYAVSKSWTQHTPTHTHTAHIPTFRQQCSLFISFQTPFPQSHWGLINALIDHAFLYHFWIRIVCTVDPWTTWIWSAWAHLHMEFFQIVNMTVLHDLVDWSWGYGS